MATDDKTSETPGDWTPNHRGRLVGLGLALALAGGLAAFLALRGGAEPPDPRRVVVLVSVERSDGRIDAWWSGRGPASERWTKHYAKHIRDLGLTPVLAGNAALDAALDELAPEATASAETQHAVGMALAKATESAWVVTGHIGARDLGDLPGGLEEHAYEVEVRLTLVSAVDGSSAPLSTREVGQRMLGLDQDVLEIIGLQVADAAVIPLAQAIVGHATFRRYLDGSDLSDAKIGKSLDTLIGKASLADDAVDAAAPPTPKPGTLPSPDKPAPVLGAVGALVGVAPDGTMWLETPDETFEYEGLNPEGYWTTHGKWITSLAPGADTAKRLRYTSRESERAVLSANGSTLAYVEDVFGVRDALYVIDVTSGEERVVSAVEGKLRHVSLSHDGRHVLFAKSEDLAGGFSVFVADTQGGEPRQLIDGDTLAVLSIPRWHADGKRIVYAAQGPGDDAPFRIFAVDVATGERSVLRDKPDPRAPAPAAPLAIDPEPPAGDAVALPDPDDPDDGSTDEEPVEDAVVYKVVAEPWRHNTLRDPLPMPDGETLLVLERDDDEGEVYLGLFTPDDDTYRRLRPTPVWVRSLAIAPDGETVALLGNVEARQGWNHQIALIDVDKGAVVRLIGRRFGERAIFAPDGRSLYLDLHGVPNVHVIRRP